MLALRQTTGANPDPKLILRTWSVAEDFEERFFVSRLWTLRPGDPRPPNEGAATRHDPCPGTQVDAATRSPFSKSLGWEAPENSDRRTYPGWGRQGRSCKDNALPNGYFSSTNSPPPRSLRMKTRTRMEKLPIIP